MVSIFYAVPCVALIEAKILGAIVGRVAVYVMDNLTFCKRTPQRLLHHDDVFQHVAILTRSRMIWMADKNVAFARFHIAATLPVGVVFPKKVMATAYQRAGARTVNSLIFANRGTTHRTVTKVFHVAPPIVIISRTYHVVQCAVSL